MYRGGNKGLHVLLSMTQAGPGRTVKQKQEEISRNHVQTFIFPSVCVSGRSALLAKMSVSLEAVCTYTLFESLPGSHIMFSHCGIAQKYEYLYHTRFVYH